MTTNVRKPFFLPEGCILRIEDGAGIRIGPDIGCLWITQEGDPRDHILAAGQSMLLAKGGLTLVEALEASQIELLAPARGQLAGSPMRVEVPAIRKAA